MTNSTTTPAPVKGNWIGQKGKLKTNFETLTGANLRYKVSKKNEMLNQVQIIPVKTNEILASIISAF